MNITKYIERLKRMNQLIRLKATGDSKALLKGEALIILKNFTPVRYHRTPSHYISPAVHFKGIVGEAEDLVE